MEAIKETAINGLDIFGGCPVCGRHDGYHNVGRSHWFVCDRHKTRWLFGENLFQSAHHEAESTWRDNHGRLSGYQEVTPKLTAGQAPQLPVFIGNSKALWDIIPPGVMATLEDFLDGNKHEMSPKVAQAAKWLDRQQEITQQYLHGHKSSTQNIVLFCIIFIVLLFLPELLTLIQL